MMMTTNGAQDMGMFLFVFFLFFFGSTDFYLLDYTCTEWGMTMARPPPPQQQQHLEWRGAVFFFYYFLLY